MRTIHQRLGALLTLFCITGGSVCLLLYVHAETAAPTLHAGSVIPDAPLISTQGENEHLHHILHGRCALIVFNTECTHCRDMMRDFLAWHERQRKPPSVITLSLSGTPETLPMSQQIPAYMLSPRTARHQLGVRSVPTLILLHDSLVCRFLSDTLITSWDRLFAQGAGGPETVQELR